MGPYPTWPQAGASRQVTPQSRKAKQTCQEILHSHWSRWTAQGPGGLPGGVIQGLSQPEREMAPGRTPFPADLIQEDLVTFGKTQQGHGLLRAQPLPKHSPVVGEYTLSH